MIEQEYALRPIDSIKPHPSNPNNGDVGAIIQSIEANGWDGDIRVQKSTGFIYDGNHRWLAAKQLGFTEIPVIERDIDDATTLRLLLAHNRIAELAYRNQSDLADLLKDMGEAGESLEATGYDTDYLDELLADLQTPGFPVDEIQPRPEKGPIECPECGHQWRP